MKITVLGARGSVPTDGKDAIDFGGATSCVLVETDEQAIFLDAGTGIVKAPDVGGKQISILLTHPHFDHLIGLPFFPYNAENGRRINVYAGKRAGLSAAQQLEKLLSPPLWPCTLSEYPADFHVHDLSLPLTIGDVTVTGMESQHPGGSTVYRLNCDGKSLVYATDYEHGEEMSALIDFAKDTDLLFYDAQYTPEEYERMRGYGHSTVEAGMKVMRESNARELRFVHHDPRHSDEMLRKMEESVKSDRIAFAKEGEVIIL